MNHESTLEEHLFNPLMETLSAPLVQSVTRSCKVLSDELFLKSGVLRVLEVVQSGREWVQNLQQHEGRAISASDYFACLESSRRLTYVEAVSAALQSQELGKLRQKTDRLASIGELEGYEVWAADGHEIEHACHDKRKTCNDGTQRYFCVNQIFALDLRSGWIRPIALCEGKESEIKALKNQTIEALKMNAKAGTILVYDRAAIDVRWWLELKNQSGICFISRSKEGFRPIHELPLEWDRKDPRNRGVLSDEMIGFNNLGQLRRIRYQDPETGEIYTFLTSEFRLPPGLIVLLYRMRWDIEKSFDEFENKLSEKKAWATTKNAKTLQGHFIALAYNLLLLILDHVDHGHGLRDIKVEKKYERWIQNRQAFAESLSRTLNDFTQSVRRVTEHSLQIIRWLRHHLRARSSLKTSLSDAWAYFTVYI